MTIIKLQTKYQINPAYTGWEKDDGNFVMDERTDARTYAEQQNMSPALHF